MSAYAPGAPAQIWALTGVSDGAKLVALWLWSKADHEVQRDPRPCTVWAPAGVRDDGSRMTPSESLLADMRGCVHPGKADRTLRGYLGELREAGLAVIDGRCVDLVPPSIADPRRDTATPRQKLAGEILPSNGENQQGDGEIQPSNGEIKPPHLNPPYPPNTTQAQQHASVPDAASEASPDIDAVMTPDAGDHEQACERCVRDTPHVALGQDRAQCCACGWLSDVTRAPQPASPEPGQAAPSKPPRRRRSQPELDLGADPPPPDEVADLLDLHERLRVEAMAAHGIAVTGWPTPKTGKGRALRLRLQAAVKLHGADGCRRYIEHRAAEWKLDAGPLVAYPPEQTWSPKIVAPTIARLTAAPANDRAAPRPSPANTRPVVRGPLPIFGADEETTP